MDLKEKISDFLRELSSDVTIDTIESYKTVLKTLKLYLVDETQLQIQRNKIDIDKINTDTIKEFIYNTFRYNLILSKRDKSFYYIVLSDFFNWLNMHDLISHDLFEVVRNFQVEDEIQENQDDIVLSISEAIESLGTGEYNDYVEGFFFVENVRRGKLFCTYEEKESIGPVIVPEQLSKKIKKEMILKIGIGLDSSNNWYILDPGTLIRD